MYMYARIYIYTHMFLYICSLERSFMRTLIVVFDKRATINIGESRFVQSGHRILLRDCIIMGPARVWGVMPGWLRVPF